MEGSCITGEHGRANVTGRDMKETEDMMIMAGKAAGMGEDTTGEGTGTTKQHFL
jgi:hypothetical protein